MDPPRNADPPRKADPPRREPAGTRETEQGSDEQGSHSTRNCSDCLALHECTLSRDNAFNATVNMLISPSHADAQAHSATTAAKSGIVRKTGAGAIAKAAEAVAAMAGATSRAREETPFEGERGVSVLLDTGASGRNFISSKVATWLIERGSATLNRSGEVGLAQQGAAITFHEHLSFRLRFLNSNLMVFETLTLSATIIDNLRLDVILGLPTVGKYLLLPKLTHLCGCCTPQGGAPQGPGVRGVAKASDWSVPPNDE